MIVKKEGRKEDKKKAKQNDFSEVFQVV